MIYNWKSIKLYHYYDKQTGPFKNLSDLSLDEAEKIQNKLIKNKTGFASKRSPDYIKIRRDLEEKARNIFISKGGKPQRQRPHYMTLGQCDWLLDWYNDPRVLTIELDYIDPTLISFTYGDLFPTMRYSDGKSYRKQVYTLSEIKSIIEDYGLPQEWNPEGKLAPERYIEVQVWTNQLFSTEESIQ